MCFTVGMRWLVVAKGDAVNYAPETTGKNVLL